MKTNQTTIFIGSGVECCGLPKKAKTKINKDLSFPNPVYVSAIKRGAFISADTSPRIELFDVDEDTNTYWVPRGYIYWLLKFLKEIKHPFILEDCTLLLGPLEITFKGKLRPYQEKAKNHMLKYPVGVLEAATGCLTGDTKVRLNRAEKGFVCSLQKLYERFNKIKTQGISTFEHKINGTVTRKFYHKQWDLTIPTMIRSYNHNENQVLLNEITDVIYSGIKKTYQFELEDGKILKGTLGHKILTSKGWKKLRDINQYDLIMIDSPKVHKSKTNQIQNDSYKVMEVRYHPNSGKTKNRRPTHILTYEAFLNDMDLDTFVHILRNDDWLSLQLKYIDSSIYVVHHIDEIKQNNELDNLRLMTHLEHNKLHGQNNKLNFGVGSITYKKVIKKKYAGKQKTYDICCKDPYNNFTANNIVVHNSGKTVIALAIIAERKQKTLIIVHSKELLFQWRDAIKKFLGIDCGLIGDGKMKIKDITVGIINTVNKKLNQLTEEFGHIILDEVHRCTASTWAETIQDFPAKYYLGLTATPFRRDGLGHAIFASIGPKIHTVDKKMLQDTGAVLVPDVYRIPTNFKYMFTNDYSTMVSQLTKDKDRNNLIVKKIASDLKKYKENIIVVSDRKHHCETMCKILQEKYGTKGRVLTGAGKKKEREEIVKEIKNGKCKVLFATISLIGEGFDAPNLTALFITTPIKFKGRLIQCVGRIRRPDKNNSNKIPRVYDFKDNQIEVLKYSGYTRDRIYIKEFGA